MGPPKKGIRGISSDGRAPALHAGGHRFDSDILHQMKTDSSIRTGVRVFESGFKLERTLKTEQQAKKSEATEKKQNCGKKS